LAQKDSDLGSPSRPSFQAKIDANQADLSRPPLIRLYSVAHPPGTRALGCMRAVAATADIEDFTWPARRWRT
jgi:hypothetical protein